MDLHAIWVPAIFLAAPLWVQLPSNDLWKQHKITSPRIIVSMWETWYKIRTTLNKTSVKYLLEQVLYNKERSKHWWVFKNIRNSMLVEMWNNSFCGKQYGDFIKNEKKSVQSRNSNFGSMFKWIEIKVIGNYLYNHVYNIIILNSSTWKKKQCPK